MNYRQLGHTNLNVSELCLGSMQFGWTADEAESFAILDAAYANGINFIDTADIYSNWVDGNPGGVSESIIGRWLKKSQVPRDKIIIATKVRGRMGSGPDDEGLSRAHITRAIEASLRRLGCDYVDLYQTHWFDENVSSEETLAALDQLVHQGKVRYLGCSNYPAWRLVEAQLLAQSYSLRQFDSLQPHYNLLHRSEFECELIDACRAYQIGVIPYSPLAGGFLTGKYRRDNIPESARQRSVSRYFNEHNWQVLELLDQIALAHAKTVSQIALAWLLANPVITSAIIGPHTLAQLDDNLGAAGLQLQAHEQKQLDEITQWKRA